MANARVSTNSVAEGWAALSAGDWAGARQCFDNAAAAAQTPEALEGLSWAGYFLADGPLTIDARERAYCLYVERGEAASAARVAAWLGADFLEFRGEAAVADGWLRRAHTLLDGREPGPDHGWLALYESYFALAMEEDTAAARRSAARAVELGRRFGVPELEMVGLGIEGRALVSEGDVRAGMRLLDEATAAALAGNATILVCVAWACCYLIAACEQVLDYERAGQWCERVGAFCERHRIAHLLGICRTKYAGVLTWQGRWEEAEAELTAALDGLRASRPPMMGDSLARLAELRRRQGRGRDAEELLARCEGNARALLVRAELALERREFEQAAEFADRFLRRVPDPGRIERCAGLEILARAYAGGAELDRARLAVDEFGRLAARVGTHPLRAGVLAAEGVIAAAGGDHDAARRAFEDALDLLAESAAPYEIARVRLELAASLVAVGRQREARREVTAALAVLEELGAGAEVARARSMLRRLPGGRPRTPAPILNGPLASLSGRELEVLTLIAEGLTNHQIAERLVLSEHTVNRHVGNILHKLQLPTRAAAASLAGRHGLA